MLSIRTKQKYRQEIVEKVIIFLVFFKALLFSYQNVEHKALDSLEYIHWYQQNKKAKAQSWINNKQ